MAQRNFAARLLARTALAGFAATGQAAFAQDAQPAGEGIQDIVVTAQRREESIQRVPVAVTALDADTLRELRVTNVKGLDSLAPGLQINTQVVQSSPTISIRGIASGVSNNAVDPKVGMYVDGVYIGRMVGSLFDLADIERIEVLRGPQGTLFGRNATSGAISIVTARPKGEWGFRGTVSYGNYNAFRAKASIDLPQVGPFSARVSYLHDQIDGDVENTLGGRTLNVTAREPAFGTFRYENTLGDRNTDAVQVAVHGDFGDVQADYRFDWTDTNAVPRAVQAFGVVPDGTGALLNGIIAFQAATGGVTNIATTPLDRVANATSNEHIRSQGHSLTLEWRAADALTVKSITGFRQFRQDPNVYDLGATGGLRFSAGQFGALLTNNIPAIFDPANAPLPNDSFFTLLTARGTSQRQFSQELQFLIDTDLVDVTSGLFYFHENSPATDVLGVFSPTVANGLIVPLPFDAIFGSGLTKTTAINSSMAAYAQGTFHLGDTIDLALGGRYTVDDRRTIISAISSAQGNALGVGDYSANFEKFNWAAILTWRPTSATTAYAKASTGYVAGGILSGIRYKPENLTAYEIGLKTKFFDNRARFNVAAFYQDFKDLQTQSFLNGRQFFENAGRAKIKGFEAELLVQPTDGLTLSADVGFADFKYKEFIQNGVDIANFARPVFTAKWTFHGAVAYETPDLGNGMTLSGRVDARWRDKLYLVNRPIVDINTGLVSPLEKYATVPAFWLVDARAGLNDIDLGGSKWSLTGFVQNVFDKRANIFGATVFQLVTTFDRGRTYGVELSTKF